MRHNIILTVKTLDISALRLATDTSQPLGSIFLLYAISANTILSELSRIMSYLYMCFCAHIPSHVTVIRWRYATYKHREHAK